ncbi:ATP-binding cassette subfamily C protein CydD [Promicromonospora sp. AC04]|uniref:thiol reductant ABC exporter subunit CydD n=1 Tax=Promicromonospora sp. AC04 TaxID=2135723 RepID=UPI000D4C605F|nr:thiol reductant ABC exporter subunit CydD [Promicromonospora sp. AC04]PUB24427.1 ATP-binding cassette subfamily C protein CydD [Promicromonospora sp. AC04]
MKPLDPRLLQQVRAARWYVALTVGLGVAAAGLIVAQALLIAALLAPVVSGDGTSGPAMAWSFAGLALVVAGRAAVAWAQERYALRAAARTIAELRHAVVEAWALRGPRASLATGGGGAGGTTADGGAGVPASGGGASVSASGGGADVPASGNGRGASPEAEVATLVTRGLDALEPYLVRYVPQLVLTALVTPALVCVVLGLDWVSAVIVIVTLPLVPVFMVLVGRLTAGTSERRLATVERLGAQVLDLVAGLPTLRAFGRSFGQGERVRALGEASSRATMGTLRIAFLSSMVLELLTTLSVAIVAVGVGLRLVEGAILLQPAIAVLVLAPEVYLPLRRVGAEFHASVDGVAAASKAFAVLGSVRSEGLADANPPMDGAGGALVLEGVSVRAGGRGVLAPAGLSARISLGTGEAGGGRVVALRGPSGSGKSTAVLAILGLLTPDAGRVGLVPRGSLDDGALHDLADVSAAGLAGWWAGLTWVPQRPTLPPGRLRDVVLDGVSEPDSDSDSERALVSAARLTGLDAVVEALPEGWDTRVGLGGVGLSVGQRQRVALTSALLDDAATKPLVILDEPTAHLDARGEQAVLDTVRAWRDAGRTVLVVAHRASLLGLADQVVDVRAAPDPAAGPTEDPDAGLAAGSAAGPVTGPVARPDAGPMTGTVARPAAGPVAGPVARPDAGPMTGPDARPDARPMTGPDARPDARPVTGPVTDREAR